jgi:hypothetical protein
VLSDALQRHPTHVRLRQLLALSMARSGAARDANAILQQLAAEGHADEETLGLLARTDKDVALHAIDPDVRRTHLARAFSRYADAYHRTGGYWSGINAATIGPSARPTGRSGGHRGRCPATLPGVERRAAAAGSLLVVGDAR